ncbi:MAG TPA: ATP-binding protein [Rectinemataceae bacterium]|nr:ATP-binding protein [Rectinemataceae bacterium]
MDAADRLQPDEALRRLAAEESSHRARLRIFLGMAAGVGKTYAMLKEARAAVRDRGLDLVVAWVEAHGRQETDALLEGLERLPPKTEAYRGIELREMDLDAVLARRPAIALVDELAHSNTPGMRHAKRHEDVMELLEAGIEVWTTVNIQHLESMADSVELLTLAPVRERVPDSFFDRADEVQLIDLPPDELLRRLAEGKVYTGSASRDAIGNFFSKTNLSALREIALRQASLFASHDTTNSLRGSGLRGPGLGAADEDRGSGGILVAVGSSPHGDALLRWARRLAYGLKAELECLHVDTGERPSEEDRSRLAANLDLARDLGASVTTVVGRDIASAIARRAAERRSFVIVVGKSGMASRRNPFRGPTLSERIIVESGSTPVFAVQERPLREALRRRAARLLEKAPPAQYAAALGAVALATALSLVVAPPVGYLSASIIYLTTISLLALALQRRALFLAAFVSALLWDFLFIPPRYTFAISRPEDVLMLALYFVIALTTGFLTSRLRANARLLAIRESRLGLMGELASELAGTSGMAAILDRSIGALSKAFDAEIVFILEDSSGGLEAGQRPPGAQVGDKARTAADWAFKKGSPAGRFTRTLPVAEWHFVPLSAPLGRVGVLGVKPKEGRAWSDDFEDWLSTMSRSVSMAVERERLAERAAAAELARESERLGALLLDSVSHELRTPLAVIEGAASAIAGEEDIGEENRRELIAEIGRGAKRLDAIVGDLLSMGRLESGSLALRLDDCDPVDIATTAIEALAGELGGMGVLVEAPPEPRPLRCDEGLVVQVLVNLLRNCRRHAGAQPRVILAVAQDSGGTSFSVRDDGPGVFETELPRLFDKFYRSGPAKTGGTGLGLSICKGIVVAHGGDIAARLLRGRGFEVEFRLPDGGPQATGLRASIMEHGKKGGEGR